MHLNLVQAAESVTAARRKVIGNPATSLFPQGLAFFLCTTDPRVSSGLATLELFLAPKEASKWWLARAEGAREEGARAGRA